MLDFKVLTTLYILISMISQLINIAFLYFFHKIKQDENNIIYKKESYIILKSKQLKNEEIILLD